jgi:hypothetical protein
MYVEILSATSPNMNVCSAFWTLLCALLSELIGFATLPISPYVQMLNYINQYLFIGIFNVLNKCQRKKILLSRNYYVLTVYLEVQTTLNASEA